MPSPSKNKGSGWERDIAKFLSSLYSESFIRAPGSGAYIGQSNAHRKTVLHDAQIRSFKGDIIPGESFPKLNIEAKFYADFPFHQMWQGNVKVLENWIGQLIATADEGDLNLLITKFNRKGAFVLFEERHVPTLTPGVHMVYEHETLGKWVMCAYEKFWDANKDAVAQLSA